MRLWLLAGCLVVLAACGGDSTGPPDVTKSVSGVWTWQANVSNASFQVSCVATATLSVSQTNTQFNGTLYNGSGTCTGPDGSSTFDPNGTISGGSVSGTVVTYTDGICSYTGVTAGNPVNKVSGDVTCNFPLNGQTVPMNGTWQISR
jgi:hypothetical protein